jgi:GT2 family glycosyltransferase
MPERAGEADLFPLVVVILNWNLPGDTIECVESFQAGLPPGARIVVIDNASTDDSLSLLRLHFGQSIEIIANPRNLGFAGGVNAAIRQLLATDTQSFFLANNDTLVAPDLLTRLSRTATSREAAGIIGPVIYYHADPARVWRYGDQQHRWLPMTYPLSPGFLDNHKQAPFQVSYVTGCGMLVRRSVFEKIGLFDERYFMYFEDADFCRRASQAGFEVWVDPQASMWHKVSLSSRGEKPQMRYYQSWGRARFHRSDPVESRRGLSGLYLLARLLWATLADILHGDWRLIRPGWRGTLDGLTGRQARSNS